MAKPFSINLVADVREFLRETGRGVDQLEKLGDTLDEMADQSERSAKEASDSVEKIGDGAKKAGDQIETHLDDAMKDAADDIERRSKQAVDDIEKIGDEAKTTGREIGDRLDAGAKEAESSTARLNDKAEAAFKRLRDRARDAGRTVGKEISDGTDKAAAGFDDMKDEAFQSGKEAAASFSGEIENIQDVIQDIAANAFVGFGPAGMAAGLASAAGLGLIWKEIEKAKDRAEELQEQFESMVDALVSEDPEAWGDMVNENMLNIAKNSEDAAVGTDKLETAMRLLEGSAISQTDLMRAYAGDAGVLPEVIENIDRHIAQIPRWTEADQGLISRLYTLKGELVGISESQDLARDAVEEYNKAQEESKTALDRTKEGTRALIEAIKEEKELREEAAEASRDYAEVLADQDDAQREVLETIHENNQSYSDQEQRLIENQAALADYVGELLAENEAAQNAGVTGKELSGIMSQNEDDFYKAASAAGYTAEEARELARRFGLIPDRVSTDIKTTGKRQTQNDIATVRDAINRIPRNVDVGVRFTVGDLAGQVWAAAARIPRVTIPVTYTHSRMSP